jgi:hypothetical protein
MCTSLVAQTQIIEFSKANMSIDKYSIWRMENKN